MAKDVIIACDFPSGGETLAFLEQFQAERPYVKIGMELFYGAGPDIVRAIHDRGHPIFLDLKLCDIPNTVKSAMRVLRDLGADMVNLHAFGTRAMMEAALEGLTRPGRLASAADRRDAAHEHERGAHEKRAPHRPPARGHRAALCRERKARGS